MMDRLYVLGTPRRLLSRILTNAFASNVGPGTRMYSYANELISMTQGRESYWTEFRSEISCRRKLPQMPVAAHNLHHEGDGEEEVALP
jgi:hypothetical protein